MLQGFLDEVSGHLEDGNRVEFRNFGVFESVERAPRKGRNLQTGSTIYIDGKRVVKFKPGKLLTERVGCHK